MAAGSRLKEFNAAHNKAELYHHSTSSWKPKASYPFHETIRAFEILAHSNSFIIFGGFYGDKQSSTGFSATGMIAKFDPGSNKWTKLGKLQQERHAFAVIETNKNYLVMGGSRDKRTETCELKNETIVCTLREPTLNNLCYYPALMTVDLDYADNC